MTPAEVCRSSRGDGLRRRGATGQAVAPHGSSSFNTDEWSVRRDLILDDPTLLSHEADIVARQNSLCIPVSPISAPPVSSGPSIGVWCRDPSVAADRSDGVNDDEVADRSARRVRLAAVTPDDVDATWLTDCFGVPWVRRLRRAGGSDLDRHGTGGGEREVRTRLDRTDQGYPTRSSASSRRRARSAEPPPCT